MLCKRRLIHPLGLIIQRSFCPPLPLDIINYISRVFPTISFFSVEWETIRDILQKAIDPNKAGGLDRISPRDLKLAGTSAVQGLFEICTKSMVDSHFPFRWKRSSVSVVSSREEG